MKLRGCGRVRQSPVSIDFNRARHALADQVDRVTALLRSVRDPHVPAIGQWSLGEVAMHLSQAWIIVPGLAGGDLSGAYEVLPHLVTRKNKSPLDDVWELPDVTMTAVDADPQRDLSVLADRIAERASAFFGALGARSDSRPHAWLVEGVSVDLPTLVCHLLNETIVHGYDIARADGRRWPIPRPDASMVVDGFLIPVVSALGPRTLVDQQAAKGLRATFEVHVRGASRHRFDFDDGRLVVDHPASRGVDCHISADPVAMLLVAWRRRSHWQAILRGQLVAWGRKPWLGPRFPTLMRNV